MNRDLVIYGAGGFGREVRLMIEQINADRAQWNILGFVDDGKAGTVVDDLEVLGGMDYLVNQSKPLSVVLALADGNLRKQLVHKLKPSRLEFPTLIHPGANTGDAKRNTFGEGTIITDGNILTTNIRMGNFVIINLMCTIGHDVILGDYCSVMPGCNISGNVTIGEGTFLGTGSKVLQNLQLGSGCKVGAGAVVVKSVGAGHTLVGVPAVQK